MKLAAHNYIFKYKPGSSHCNADALSRLPLPNEGNLDNQIDTVEVYLTELDRAPVSAEEVRIHSRRDPVIAKMIDNVRTRRFPGDDPDFKYFVNKPDQLSVEDGWGNRVVIPNALREKVSEELHQAHPGINWIKGLARTYVWWPNMDNVNLKNWWNTAIRVERTRTCLKRHVIIIDAYSMWLEVIPTLGCNADVTIC